MPCFPYAFVIVLCEKRVSMMCCKGLSCACSFLYVRPQVEIEGFQVWRTECPGMLTYTACLPVYVYVSI